MTQVSIPPRLDVCEILTGIYTGDGLNFRTIDIDVNLAGRANAYVIVKHQGPQIAAHRIEYGQGDLGAFFDERIDTPNSLQEFMTAGFKVGVNAVVNQDTFIYRYTVFWTEP